MSETPPQADEQARLSLRMYEAVVSGISSKQARVAALGGALWLGAVVGGNTAIELAGETEGEVCAVTATVEHTPFTIHTSEPSVEAQLAPGFSANIPKASSNPFLKSSVSITDIDKEEIKTLQQTLESGSTSELQALEEVCRREARALVVESGKNAIAVGGIGALIGSLSVYAGINVLRPTEMNRKRRLLLLASATLFAALPGLSSMAWAGSTVNEEAFKNPRYEGYLKDIEEIVDSGKLTLKGYQEKSGELTRWIEQIAQLQQELTAPTEDDGYLRFMVISDIHSRPCAYERIALLAAAYDTEFILNPGDEYEWAETESGLLAPKGGCNGVNGPDDIKQPIFQVKGNHDPDSAMKMLDQIDNVTVLDEEPSTIYYTIGGVKRKLTLMGIPDLRYTPDDEMQGADEAKTNLLELYLPERFEAIEKAKPDILMTHDPQLLKEMSQEDLIPESASLLAAGHTHTAKVHQKTDYNAPLLVTGSSGGGGLRTYEGNGQPSAYSMVFMDPATKKVVRIELISVSNEGVVTIENVDVQQAAN